jgi:hypothetical protein
VAKTNPNVCNTCMDCVQLCAHQAIAYKRNALVPAKQARQAVLATGGISSSVTESQDVQAAD